MEAREMLDADLPADQMVPGLPEAIDGAAATSANMSERMYDIAQSLEYIEVEWDGEAATAFRSYFDMQPDRFRDAARRFATAAEALRDHAEVMRAARHEASTARSLYRLAKAAAPQQLGVPTPYRPDYVVPGTSTPEMDYAVEKLGAALQSLESSSSRNGRALREAGGPETEPTSFVGPAPESNRAVNFAGGMARGLAEVAGIMTTPATYFQTTGPLLDDLERQFGVQRDGFYWAGLIGSGFVLPGGGAGALVRHSASVTQRGLSAAAVRGVSLRVPGFAPTIQVHAMTLPPPGGWTPETIRFWVNDVLSDPTRVRNAVGSGASHDYQVVHAGGQEIKLVTLDGQTKIWADGISIGSDGVAAVDAKYVLTPGGRSQMYEGTSPDFLLEQFDDEMQRYAAVVADLSNPIDRVRIVTNTDAAGEFLGDRARSLIGDGVDIEVVVTP